MSASPRECFEQAPSIDIVRESPLWEKQLDIDAMLRRAIAEAAASVATKDTELAIVLTDDSRIRALNRVWRGSDKPTDVLSFPAKKHGQSGPTALLGDIVIAYETTARDAAAQDTPFLHHLAHLAVHGFLHLHGYDHEVEEEAEAMERIECEILARLHIPDPYSARDTDVTDRHA
ncbi:MAG: rRNA maturation RNase YbeY [Xanthobacteraceae bacterium]